ncbi:urotensin 1 [Scleropages formosus]|nr:urocortin [Scleropages formosus]
MKPLPLLLLLATVLASTRIRPSAARPRDSRVFFDGHGFESRLDDALLKAGDDALSYLIGAEVLRYLRSHPAFHGALLRVPAARARQGVAAALGRAARGDEEGYGDGDEDGALAPQELVDVSRRSDDPPISIDLTFHLLRNMIEMARIESQKEQAELNRKYLDEVGK